MPTSQGIAFDLLTKNLLTDWCDGMLKQQINDPSDPTRYGALACPSCDGQGGVHYYSGEGYSKCRI